MNVKLIKAWICCYAVLFFSSTSIAATAELHLVLPNFPPYSYQHNGEIKGIAVKLVTPVLQQLSVSYKLTLVKDYGLALNLVKHGMADGFLLASQNNMRDQVALFSTPVMINRWCWYINKQHKLNPQDSLNFKFNAEIGTIGKTNTERWLIKHGYPIKTAPLATKALAKLLLEGKINTAFVAEKVFDLALGSNISKVKKVIAIEKPFGIYISKSFIKHHPNFMKKLNAAISARQSLTPLSNKSD